MFLPYHNARLTLVKGGGTSEDYDVAEGADTARWSGSAEAQVVERVLEAVSGERLDQVKQTTLVIPANLGIGVETGDSVTYTFADGSHTRDVRVIEDHSALGIIRLTLESG